MFVARIIPVRSYDSSVHDLGMGEESHLQFGRSNLKALDFDQFLRWC
jgi:hypothetical protein